ncbi:MAG: alpha/beta hydrolase [Pirellulaceae bacterium]
MMCRTLLLPWGVLGVIAAWSVAWTERAAAESVGPVPMRIWPRGAPGKVGDEPGDHPELRVYLPETADRTGTGVVVCPGGGYGVLATDHEGHQVAKWLNRIGVAAFVLKYRLAPRYRHPAPLQDAQRAIRFVRSQAETYGVSPRRIGILGFSAGGHLASTAATHFDDGKAEHDDPVERVSCRPDFVVLGYPVISFQESYAHRGSARNLLGDQADAALLADLSNDQRVTPRCPPAFLFHTGDDTGVPAENSVSYFLGCRKAGVPAELHVYRYGPHGVGLAPGDAAASTWKDRLADWLRASGLLSDTERAAVEGTVRVDGKPLRWGMISFVPTDSPHKPSAFAMVSRGEFKIAAAGGPAVGPCRIEIRDLGAVEPQPTIEDARQLDQGQHQCEVKAGSNRITVELSPPQG